MKKVFLQFVLIAIPVIVTYAQTPNITNTTQNTTVTEDLQLAPEGSFIFISKTKQQEVFTTERYSEIRKFVEENRNQDQELILEVSSMTIVRIPPRRVVDRADFRPFETLFEE